MTSNKKTENKMCPSYIAKVGAQLFGIVNKEGNINFITTPLQVTKQFLEDNVEKTSLEKRFRFTGKCIEKGCMQWEDSLQVCSLPKTVQNLQQPATKISDCPIRNKCRWFYQEQHNACISCNEVIRNMEDLVNK